MLDMSVPSVNSALQRARATLRRVLPERRMDSTVASEPTAAEREVLRRYIDASERADLHSLAALLREDARMAMPPHRGPLSAGRRSSSCGGRQSLGRTRSASSASFRPAPTASQQRRPTCGARVTTAIGRWRSTCCGSKTASWPRSPPSVPAGSRASGSPPRLAIPKAHHSRTRCRRDRRTIRKPPLSRPSSLPASRSG